MRAKLIHSDLLYVASLNVLKQVKQNLGKYKKHIIIVPDKYTLISENLLLDACETKCLFDAEVLSLNRFCSKVVSLDEAINKQGGTILVQRLLFENNDKLKVFKDMYKKVGFASELYATIMQIKASAITPDLLKDDDSDEVLLQSKIDDIKLVYTLYEKEVNNGLSDGLLKLEKLNDIIRQSNVFDGVAFYFAFFDFFTRQEYKIIESLIVKNNYVVLGCSYGLQKPNEYIYSNDVYTQLSSLFFKYNLKDIVEVNEVLPAYFEKLKNELFAFSPKLEKLSSNDILLYCANGERQEIENIAKIIKTNIYLGKKYNQICVGVSNVEKYERVIKDVFSSYNIPYYLDMSIKLDSTELGRFVNAILKGISYGFMEEDLKSIIFNYYFGIDDEVVKEALYKFICMLNPSGIRWIDKTFDGIDENVLRGLDIVKEKLKYIYNTFKGLGTAKEYVYAIRDIYTYFNIDIKTNELIDILKDDLMVSKTLIQLPTKFNELLNQIEDLSKETKLDAYEFLSLLQNGLDVCKINLVPQSVDCVFVGDLNSSSFERKDIYILAGINLNLAPKINYDLGIVSDDDIDNLKEKYLIEPKISQINMRSRQKLFEICVLPKKQLIISYLESSDSGEVLKPSSLIMSLCKMFYIEKNGKKELISAINVVEDLKAYMMLQKSMDFQNGECANDNMGDFAKLKYKISNMENCYKYLLTDKKYGQTLYKLLLRTEDKEYLNRLINLSNEITQKDKLNVAKDLFFVNGKTSATQITEFYMCPYLHFLKRGLKLKEDLPFALNKMDIGQILHSTCELFGKQLIVCKDYNKLNLEAVKAGIITQIKKMYSSIMENEDNRFIIPSLIKESEKLMDKLYDFALNSTFRISKSEYDFKPIKIENGIKDVKLVGKIDRVDYLDNKFTIIDYKTGNAELNAKKIYYGLKIQLLIYALAITKENNYQVAGFGYYPIKDRFLKNEQGTVQDYKVNGYYLKEKDVLESLDNTIKDCDCKTESKYYNFYIDEDMGKVSLNLFEREDLIKMCSYVKSLLENAVNDILCGEISVAPYKDSKKLPCANCKYKGICKKDLYCKERQLSNKSIKDILI